MSFLNELTAKQDHIRAMLRDLKISEDKTIISAALSKATDISEDAVVNVTLALAETFFLDEVKPGTLFQSYSLIDYLDSLGMRITWKNETH